MVGDQMTEIVSIIMHQGHSIVVFKDIMTTIIHISQHFSQNGTYHTSHF